MLNIGIDIGGTKITGRVVDDLPVEAAIAPAALVDAGFVFGAGRGMSDTVVPTPGIGVADLAGMER